MSGGFFRGTSADQDTRFSNKTAKLLKTQKFAPELDQLVDSNKIKMDVMRPWIATRATQFLGFEDEVLINFICGLLEGKNVDGKQIQIQLTGFMEKNTGKFMRELWGLLTSAQNNISGIPQQFLDEKAEEARNKKDEEQRVISEVQRKEEEKDADRERSKKQDVSVEAANIAGPAATTKTRLSSSPTGGRSPDGAPNYAENGIIDSRPSRSRIRSGSHLSSKSVSRSPRPGSRRHVSRSVSRSPPRRLRRSRSPPRRGRSPNNVQQLRSRSPSRRGRSPNNARSPRRRHHSPAYSRSPRGRSPIVAPRSPRRQRSPALPHSPRGRSPIARSPRRRSPPVFSRSARSPPRYRRRSPRYIRSPSRRRPPASPPSRRRQGAASPQRYADLTRSPRRRPPPQSLRRGSPSFRQLPARSVSPETLSKSPPQLRHPARSPQWPSSLSPPRQSARSLSPRRRNLLLSSPQPKIPPPPPRGRSSRGSLSPLRQRSPPSSFQHHSVRSPSPAAHLVNPASVLRNAGNSVQSPFRGTHRALPLQHRTPSPSSSPPMQRRSPSFSKASPPNEKSCSQSRSPLRGRSFTRERMESYARIEQTNQKIIESVPSNNRPRKRTRSPSRDSSMSAENRQAALPKRPSGFDATAGVSSAVIRQVRKVEEPVRSASKSSDDDHQRSPAENRSNMESDGDEGPGIGLPVNVDDRKAAKKLRKEEKRMRKEDKKRKREEKHKRKEEKRASKASSKGITSVTPPPDLDNHMMRSDDFDSTDEGHKVKEDDTEIEQRRLENELRRKALHVIRARKPVSS